jgi:hypothetical protein
VSPRWLIVLVVLGGTVWLLQAARSQRGASMVGMSAPAAPQLAPAVNAVPEPPPAPSVIEAPRAEPLEPLGPGVVEAPNEVEPLPGGWSEQVSTQEQPTIEVTNTLPPDEMSAALIFRNGTAVFELNCEKPYSSMQIPAGAYDYELHGLRWERQREPDQFGRFRCRRYHQYSVNLGTRPADSERHRDLGDKN